MQIKQCIWYVGSESQSLWFLMDDEEKEVEEGGMEMASSRKSDCIGFVGVGSEIGEIVGEGNTSQPSPCISFIIIPLYCEPAFE